MLLALSTNLYKFVWVRCLLIKSLLASVTHLYFSAFWISCFHCWNLVFEAQDSSHSLATQPTPCWPIPSSKVTGLPQWVVDAQPALRIGKGLGSRSHICFFILFWCGWETLTIFACQLAGKANIPFGVSNTYNILNFAGDALYLHLDMSISFLS